LQSIKNNEFNKQINTIKMAKEKAKVKKVTLEDRWNEKKAAMKKSYPKLTDDDIMYAEEDAHQALLNNLSVKTGQSFEDTIIWLDSL
jgi:hypothetical protein